jgi:hypothetical protein
MRGLDFELDRLLNPASAFDHPRDVLSDADLTKQEKARDLVVLGV